MYPQLFLCYPADFDGFVHSNPRNLTISTIVGGAVSLECDYIAPGNTLTVEWYANGIFIRRITMISENIVHVYLDRGRYLFIRALTAEQRAATYQCEVVFGSPLMRIASPTIYTLNANLSEAGITEYKDLGSRRAAPEGTVNFVYAAASRDEAGNLAPFSLLCQSNRHVLVTVSNSFIAVAKLSAEGSNEIEVNFTCSLGGNYVDSRILVGTIVILREYYKLFKMLK